MVRLRLLVVIANYGTKNDVYLRRLIDEYRTLPYQVDILVLTNVPKTVEGATAVIVLPPTGDPWTFPFAHKALIAERSSDYDLFIYSEDDTLITYDNLEAFLSASQVVKDGEIAGFLRYETTPEGRRSISTINGHFHWQPASVVTRGRHTFAYFSNEHAASYVLTRQQLARAIQSGGFLTPPHSDKYDLLVTAATDPYTQCGFKKLICVSEVDRFLVAHLPNKYIGEFGVDVEDFRQQIEALNEIGQGHRRPTQLLQTETRVPLQQWSKRFYERPPEDVVRIVPKEAETVLSFGSGSGELEATLMRRGAKLTAAPLDSVIGAGVEARGIEVVYGDAHTVLEAVSDRRFDCILMLELLHLAPEPTRLLEELSKVLSDNGTLVISVPNMLKAHVLARLRRRPTPSDVEFSHSGVHFCSYWQVKKWFEAAGLRISSTTAIGSSNKHWLHQAAGRLFPAGVASEMLIVGKRISNRPIERRRASRDQEMSSTGRR